jgi:hypothetical protein
MGFLFSGHYFLFKKEKTIPAKKTFLKGLFVHPLLVFQVFVFMREELQQVFICFH